MDKKILNRQMVIIPYEDGGFTASVPSLPGCHTQGDSWEETIANVKEVIELFIEDTLENGETVPEDNAPRLETQNPVDVVSSHRAARLALWL